jgi:hypothetical protein
MMFEKKHMMIPVEVAEEEVNNRIQEKENELNEIIENHADTINMMKMLSPIKGHVIPDHAIQEPCNIGDPTGFRTVDKIAIYTGDEVKMPSGERGIVIKKDDGYAILTNYYTYYLKKESNVPVDYKITLTPEDIEITRHFNTYMNGIEIAKGRRGFKGFNVRICLDNEEDSNKRKIKINDLLINMQGIVRVVIPENFNKGLDLGINMDGKFVPLKKLNLKEWAVMPDYSFWIREPYLYHITSKDRVKHIMKNGLDPGSEKSTINDKDLIYLTSDYNFIIETDEEFWRSDLALLKVDITGILKELGADEEYEPGTSDIDGSVSDIKSFTYNKKISPDLIEYVGELELFDISSEVPIKRAMLKKSKKL